jgi:hypothetical protein
MKEGEHRNKLTGEVLSRFYQWSAGADKTLALQEQVTLLHALNLDLTSDKSPADTLSVGSIQMNKYKFSLFP